MNYFFTIFHNLVNIRRLAFVLCLLLTFGLVVFVSIECYSMSLKWWKMEQSIAQQKRNGIRDVVVDKTTFIARYWGYGDWGNPVTGTGDWVNESYAKAYGVDTFSVQ